MSDYVESYSEPHETTWHTKWQCVWCAQSIHKGQSHWRYNGWWEGMKQNWGMHSECYNDGFGKLFNHEGGCFEKHGYKRGSVEEL